MIVIYFPKFIDIQEKNHVLNKTYPKYITVDHVECINVLYYFRK